jgi:hypothetical protein
LAHRHLHIITLKIHPSLLIHQYLKEDPAYNPAINNKEMDVFLMNDASVVRNITFQAHGGFAEVLDPDGQVLTKSPYTQTASSFSQSVNAKSFRGGMYVDGYAGNVEMRVVGLNSAFSLEVASLPGTGLYFTQTSNACTILH